MIAFVRFALAAVRYGFRFGVSALLIFALLAPATLSVGAEAARRNSGSRNSIFDGNNAAASANTGAPEPFTVRDNRTAPQRVLSASTLR